MDVLDGKDLLIPLNLTEADALAFSTPVAIKVVEVRGKKSYNNEEIWVNVRAWLVFFQNSRYITISWS